MNAPGTAGLGGLGAALGGGAPGTAPAAPATPDQNPDNGTKQVMITSEADGSFTVQPMADGQPQGDPIPAKSIDEAVQGAADALGTTLSAEGSPSEEAGESPAEEGAEGPAGEAAEGEAGQPESGPGEVAPNPDEEKAQYAQKSGTRPKKKPGWGDYMSMKNPMAK